MFTDDWLRELFELGKRFERIRSGGPLPFCSGELLLLIELARAEEEGRGVIAGDLAKALGVTRSAVSQSLRKLERRGTVRRVRIFGRTDVCLTEQGRREYTVCRGQAERVMQAAAARCGESALEGLFAGLRRFFDAAEEALRRTGGAAAQG